MMFRHFTSLVKHIVRLKMISLPKRTKLKLAMFAILFLVFSIGFFLRVLMYFAGRPESCNSFAIQHPESLKVVAKPGNCSNAETNDNANMGTILKEVKTTSINSLSHFQAKVSEKPKTFEKQSPSPSAKPTIDMLNDYYPFVDFRFAFPEISPKIDRRQNNFIMVLVNSGAKGDEFRKRREAIRKTWGNQSSCEQRKTLSDEKLKNLRWQLVFVVGKAGPGTKDDDVNMAEAKEHNDMLIGNITDNYVNNVIKFYMGLLWANGFDQKYILKTDDDVYVRIPRIVEYLVNVRFPKPFYGGWAVKPHKVQRVVGNKWAVSWKYYGRVNFPWFNTGAFFILSNDLLIRLFKYVYIRKPFHVDDAYVGLAMRDFKVKVTRIRSLFLMHNINEFLYEATDCELLGIKGFAHGMLPELSTFLHDRLSSLICRNTTIQC